MYELPGSLRLTSTFPFVGRSPELETLRALMPMAEGEGRRVVLLSGEPGSGKSRLVREFAGEAAASGALVLYGACDAVVPTPYGPFVEALEHATRVVDPAELRVALGTSGGELTRLLPDLPTRVGDLPAPVEADADTERHRLHTAVTELLVGLSARPVLLVLEDGHWADASTLLLLRHLARAAGNARVLLLATFRDTEADVPQTLSQTLADLRRSDDVVRLRLSGLSDDDVAEFLRHAAEGDAGAGQPELARAIGELTGGNAFLVCELWRALVETGIVEVVEGTIRPTRPLAELGTPESVREVVSQRLSRLAPPTIDLLELTATAGSEFGLDIVRQAAGLSEPDLLAALDEAVRSAMIEELPSRRLAYRFTHELVRRALYDRLSAVRRAEMHLRVGEALERSDDRSGRALADLAHHFAAAAPLDGAQRGIEYNVTAARAAAAAVAFDEAATRLRTALELGIESRATRAEVFLELGTASHRAGDAVDALEAFKETAAIARELGNGELLARAAIGYEEACWRPGIADRGAVELLEEAATALGDDNPELRAGLLSGLARGLVFQGEHERGAIVRTNAIALARQLRDPVPLATVLVRSYWSRGTTSLDEILAMLTEAVDVGEELGDTEILAEAMAWRVPTFVALGDLESARREVAALLATAEQTAQPFMLHVAEHYGSSIALCDGRLDEAEARARHSHEWSRLLGGSDAAGVYGIQMFNIRREQGRLAELAPVIRILAGDADRGGPWQPGLVSVLVELGMDTEARRRARARGRRRARPVSRIAVARRARLPDRRLRGARRRGHCRAGLPRARAARRDERDDRPSGGLPRSSRSLPGHARGDPRRRRPRRAALRARHGAQPPDGSRDLARPHRLPVRPHAAGARARRARPGRRAARRGVRAGRAHRDAGAAGPRSRPRLLGAGQAPSRPAVAARGRDPVPRGPGHEQPRDRRHAVHQRAHGRQPHPQHPAQDELREPHRGRLVRA